MLDLGTGSGSTVSDAYGINASGEVTGQAGNVFLWKGEGIMDTGIDGTGTAINDASTIAGSYFTGSFKAGLFGDESPIYHAFSWNGSLMTDLGTLGGTSSAAFAINNSDEVTGAADTTGDVARDAFLWNGTRMIDLGNLGGESQGQAINGLGEVAGWSQVAPTFNEHASLWNGSTILDLGTLGGAESQADGINAAAAVVGWSNVGTGDRHAFLYTDGTMVDLNSLVDPASGWTLVEATAINDAGQIAGYGLNDATGDTEAFLLTPVPEPRTLGLAIMGATFACSTFSNRRRKRHPHHPSEIAP
jgi:probable HAF family extracellular repeat protein